MNKSKLLISSCILCAFSNSALAAMDIRDEKTSFYERNKPQPIGLNYTYAEINYIHTRVDEENLADDSVQGIGAEISFQTSPNTSASLKLVGIGYNFDDELVGASELIIGVNYHYPLSRDSDVYTEFNIISIVAEDSNNSNSASGNALFLGIRQRINANMEWGIGVAAVKIGDEIDTKTRLSYAYGGDNETQYISRIESMNTDNKTTTLFLGIRLNY